MKTKNITWSKELTEVVVSIRAKRPDLKSDSAVIHAAVVDLDLRVEAVKRPQVTAIPPNFPPFRRD